MKLEIVKETRINGDIVYSIERDGQYVSNSASATLKEAEIMFDRIAEIGNTNGTIKEIIKTTEI